MKNTKMEKLTPPQENKGLREEHTDKIKNIWDAGDKAFLEGFNAPIDQEIIDLYPELNEQKKPIKTK
jgi:hypothetical protein